MNKCFLGVCVSLLLSGCASTSTFNAYTSQINPLIQDIKNNKMLDLKKQFADKVNSSDKILYLMERGRIAQIQGDFTASQADFEAAMEAIKINDEKAVISASGAGAHASSIMTNDNAISYKGEGYERVMLYQFQAMNYLAKNDLEGAGVEVRKANREQEEALKRHDKEIDQAKDSAKKNQVAETTPDAVTSAYAGLDLIAGKVKNSFQNAYSFYLSGLIYEMQGQKNDASIDYKKALEIFPDNTYLQKDIERLAANTNQPNTGELIVLLEDDLVAQKEQIKIPIPVSLSAITLTSVAFPIYNIKAFDPLPFELSEGGSLLGASQSICYFNALAVKSLKERLPSMVIHQVIRSTAKAAAAKTAENSLGWVASLGASAYNFISENADLRSWLTLPADAQIIRVSLSPGEHEFVLTHKESGASVSVKVTIKEKDKALLRVIRVGNKLYYTQLK